MKGYECILGSNVDCKKISGQIVRMTTTSNRVAFQNFLSCVMNKIESTFRLSWKADERQTSDHEWTQSTIS